jgi:hypothetical protein
MHVSAERHVQCSLVVGAGLVCLELAVYSTTSSPSVLGIVETYVVSSM